MIRLYEKRLRPVRYKKMNHRQEDPSKLPSGRDAISKIPESVTNGWMVSWACRMLLLSVTMIFILMFADQSAFAADADKAIEIFKKYKCYKCHSIESQGIAQTKAADEEDEEELEEDEEPPDLSEVGKERDAKWIARFLRKKEKIEGKKHKKRFKGKKEELKTLALWLETLK